MNPDSSPRFAVAGSEETSNRTTASTLPTSSSSGATASATTASNSTNNSNNNMNNNCLPTTDVVAPMQRRNLSEAFEELYIATPAVDVDNNSATAAKTPGSIKPSNTGDDESSSLHKTVNLISPTGVADLHPTVPFSAGKALQAVDNGAAAVVEEDDDEDDAAALPFFQLHVDLKKDLSQAVINRVSFYGVIHDINKEAAAMAANDDSGLNRTSPGTGEDMSEDCSPLVEAVKGPSANPPELDSDMILAACIDEERWLLSAIETRGADESRSIQACPPTFLQAMGEREYENPLTSLSSGSRTQLWKPSRSWWEAKSGKNPWIEPKSHNKRWRYLWPLIHYHKFLAKCIKKLKRNGVDVKQSVSPVAAFLREEVCAVSDHLASVSLFDSDKWMSCLLHFSGWTDTSAESESTLRVLIGQLYLRPLAEHGDVESPLLRSQVDEQYLRAMASQRSQMEMGPETERSHKHGNHKGRQASLHRNRAMEQGPPHNMHQVPSQVDGHARGSGVRRPRFGYNYPYQYWNQGWHQGHYQHPYGDDTSVHSSLSGDAYSEQYGMYPGAAVPNGHFYPPVYHHPHSQEHSHPNGAFDPSMSGEAGMYPMHTPYHPDHAGLGFYGHPPVDPNMAYGMHHQPGEAMGGYYGMPQTPKASSHGTPPTQQHDAGDNGHQADTFATDHQTPFKYDPSKTPARSPYWGHLDSTIAMGLSTPQTLAKEEHGHFVSPEEGADAAGVGGAAQPLLLQQSQYYGYGPVSNYGPPSPATQFMMSPQANFAMNYGYGYSPNQGGRVPSHFKQSSPKHGGSRRKGANSSSLKKVPPGLFPPVASNSGNQTPDKIDRHSPSTVETIAESETLSDAT